MGLRDGDEEFRKLLQNPPKPNLSGAEMSDEMKQYLHDSENGCMVRDSHKDAKDAAEAELSKITLFCPNCRRPDRLKVAGLNRFACGHCGIETNSPLRIADTKTENPKLENADLDTDKRLGELLAKKS